MKAADTTLYWAKADGGDRYALFDADRHRADVARFALSARMPEALANGEFVVEYQPLVRLRDQQIIGVEALVRWQLPTGERLAARRVHPARRRDRAHRAPGPRGAAARPAGRPPDGVTQDPTIRLLMSVNLAARQVREPGLVDDVLQILSETAGGPPSCCNSNSPRARSWARTETRSPRCATWPTSASASPSTTSAPATRTWPTCDTCPCTPSNSPAPSSPAAAATDHTDRRPRHRGGHRPARPHPGPVRHRRIRRNRSPIHPAPRPRLRHRAGLVLRTGLPAEQIPALFHTSPCIYQQTRPSDSPRTPLDPGSMADVGQREDRPRCKHGESAWRSGRN